MPFLPTYQTSDRTLSLMQTKWASILNAVLAKPQANSNVLQEVSLAVGANSIDHKLGRKLQGWSIVRQRAAASVYDAQDSNANSDLTLNLVSSAAVVVDLLVF